MDEVSQAVGTVKRLLKAQGLTYRDVAKALDLSEASVKRVFSDESFTVERLARIARLLGYHAGGAARRIGLAGAAAAHADGRAGSEGRG